MRLRWRCYLNQRPEFYISNSILDYQRVAKALKAVIETDLLQDRYDVTLTKYKALVDKAALQDSIIEEQVIYVPPHIDITAHQQVEKSFDIIKEFNNYLGVKGLQEINLPFYYHYTRQMLIRWGSIDLDSIPSRLSNEAFSNRTFNDRRNCLFKFFE